MKNSLKIAVISVVGLLAITVIAATTINSLPLTKAAPYGKLVSSEARDSDGNDRKGFGDEVSPLARDQTDPSPDGQNGLKEFRESGVPARNFDGDGPGQSDEDHGNDD